MSFDARKAPLKAFNNYVLVKLLEKEDLKKVGSIYIPTENSTIENQDTGEVIGMGDIAFDHYPKYHDLPKPDLIGKYVVFQYRANDSQYYNRSTDDVPDENKGHYRLVADRDIMCILDDEKASK